MLSHAVFEISRHPGVKNSRLAREGWTRNKSSFVRFRQAALRHPSSDGFSSGFVIPTEVPRHWRDARDGAGGPLFVLHHTSSFTPIIFYGFAFIRARSVSAPTNPHAFHALPVTTSRNNCSGCSGSWLYRCQFPTP